MTLVLVRGSGDVGSAVAHALLESGTASVVVHDEPRPSHPRRGMSFTDALYDGAATLGGVVGKRAKEEADLPPMVRCRRAIVLTELPFDEVMWLLAPDVLLDARMRKRAVPESQRGLAPFVIGLGPNFEAGANADLVVETGWGDDLGKIIRTGRCRNFAGEPQMIGGHARDRYVYCPCAGEFSTALQNGVLLLPDRKSPASVPQSSRLRCPAGCGG